MFVAFLSERYFNTAMVGYQTVIADGSFNKDSSDYLDNEFEENQGAYDQVLRRYSNSNVLRSSLFA